MTDNQRKLNHNEYLFATCIHNLKGENCTRDGYPIIDCLSCNSYKKIETTELETFPDEDTAYCKVFEVPTDWLYGIIRTMDEYQTEILSPKQILDTFFWIDNEEIYRIAKQKGKLLREEHK